MKIVSLCPSVTELVFDLGCGADLVGITTFCVHPADQVGGIETVGGTKDPDVTRIIELKPDIVLLNEEENRREDAEALERAGVACHVSFPKVIADTAAFVRAVGARLGRPAQAGAIALDIEQRAQRVRSASASLREVTWAYLIWRKPWMSVNADTFVDALLGLAGGRNVFADRAERYPVISAEELGLASPDVILAASEPFPFEAKHLDELAKASGLPRERFTVVDGEYLSWHGSRTPDGIDYAEACLARAR
ncbi:MAG: iron complex transport system substrate-binding protein [Chlamydiales bacterium]|jgi:iron complex transport system substrate-binding protein